MGPDQDVPADLVERLVARALDAIPPPFAEQLASVAVTVADEPSPEELASVGARGLFGLYQGVPRTAWAAGQAPVASRITIFRGPLVRAFGLGPALADAVEDTVRHEIAHHLGISDERLRELAARRR